ncbi:MAG: hypothetical protein [Olavius algarvensis Gamma 3 endosymbiont]|nr:MAG: hypothetical protein [Olavius algarvensis Gamma 3 endosymbiont]
MNLFLVVSITAGTVLLGTGLCFYLLYQAREVATTVWILEHIICPIIRILVLLVVVSQIYPVIDENSTSLDFWQALAQQNEFRDIVNILFVAGLLLAFLPLVSHPVFALPLQSTFSIALVFHGQYLQAMGGLTLIPSIATILKLIAYMALAYFVTRELSIPLSRWVDRRLVVEGSIRLVSDAIYMVLQIPVMLIYCGFLKAQLT